MSIVHETTEVLELNSKIKALTDQNTLLEARLNFSEYSISSLMKSIKRLEGRILHQDTVIKNLRNLTGAREIEYDQAGNTK